jgi:hypothetical protein
MSVKQSRALGIVAALIVSTLTAHAQSPAFRVDPYWPKPLPNNWILGQVGGMSVDAQDNIWVFQRPRSLTDDKGAALEMLRAGAPAEMGADRVARSPGRQDHGAAFAEADARMAGLFAKTAEDDLIAVFDETALLAARKRNRFGAARGEFEQAAPTRFLRSGNGA